MVVDTGAPFDTLYAVQLGAREDGERVQELLKQAKSTFNDAKLFCGVPQRAGPPSPAEAPLTGPPSYKLGSA
ncbi:hypothetical protein AMK21_16830 [Streptomyces sp. CB00316]|nr:hypothetical protein AMK21_16830 [Streptomyces sp. CB00316]